MRIERTLEAVAAKALTDALDVEAPPVLRPTQDGKHGDYQLNGALPLAKRLKENPRAIAQRLADRLAEEDAFAEVEVAGPGFVNLRLDDGWIGARLTEQLADRARDGIDPVEAPETIVVDFSSPNIAKQMHVGHLRSTIIGDCLVRLLRAVGHTVIGDNHLGDWGTQFGLLIVGMRRFGDEAALEATPMVELERVYKLASKQAKEDEAFADEARGELAKLQAGDEENLALWRRFVATTRQSLETMYGRLDVHFDTWLGESAYHDELPGVVDLLTKEGIAVESQGAIAVLFEHLEGADAKLRKQKLAFIVRKKDGAFNYATSDVATVLHRKAKLGADRAIYVVDSRQSDHFKQLFEVMRLLGVEIELEHIGFGTILGADNKPIRTRDGGTVTLASLLDEAIDRSAKFMKESFPERDEAEIDALARVLGIAIVKYADLSQNRLSNYQFDWDKLIAMDGNSPPYVEYQHARVCSMFDKGGVDPSALAGPIVVAHEAEKALARRLLRFGEVVHAATEQRLPHLVADHVYRLGRDASSFYEHCPVLSSEGATRESRLALCDLVRRQLARGLGLLGIPAVERM